MYYDNASVGHNKLGTFMTEISRMAKLSHEYTNHSCRATTVSLPEKQNKVSCISTYISTLGRYENIK
jgi:hypothetical protein